MTTLRLVIFDVDGTLVDSQAHIVAAMDRAFASIGRARPPREAILSIVGLSLPVAMARLATDAPDRVPALVEAYKDAFVDLRQGDDGHTLSPLFPGARDSLEALAGEPWTLLGVATGKSRRGLDHVLELHDLRAFFHTVQVADDHPSKPHPSMVEACLSETGVDAGRAVVVGDTVFDIEMARAAGVRSVGVSWGYHAPEALVEAGAACVVNRFSDLPRALDRALSAP